jgi:hypothetical protein
MPQKKTASSRPVQVGDMVRIRSGDQYPITGRVLLIREPIAPGYDRIIRVRMRGKPIPAYVEVLDDQVELVTTNGSGKTS